MALEQLMEWVSSHPVHTELMGIEAMGILGMTYCLVKMGLEIIYRPAEKYSTGQSEE